MAYNTKAIKTDVNGNPISQYYNPETDEYEPVEGAGGGNKVILYNEDGTPNNSLSLGEILDKLDQLTGTVIAEQYRQQNEAIRQQNEQDRIDLYNALKDLDVSQYELRLQKLEHDTSVEETVVEEVYGPVIPLPENIVNGQINEIRIEGKTYRNVLEDYFGKSDSWQTLNGELIDDDFLKGTVTADGKYKNFYLKPDIINLKPNTQYTIFVEVRKNTLTNGGLYVTSVHQNDPFLVTNAISPGKTGIFKFLVPTKSDLTDTFPLRMFITNQATSGEIEFRVMLLEGDYTNENISYIRGTKSTLGAIRLKSVNEDETKESTLYILGKDEEGNILELHSLPNGVKDEIDVSERKLIKRTKKIIFDGSENWTEFTTIYADTKGFYRMRINGWVTQNKAVTGFDTGLAWNDLATFRIVTSIGESGFPNSIAFHENGSLYLSLPRDYIDANYSPSIEGMRQYLNDHPITLIYQLAEPIEIPVEVFGSLQSYEKGTVYVDTIIPRVDFYTPDGIYFEELPEKEPKIKEIDSLYLVNKENGYLTELDISKAFIFPDGKGFTHPDLFTGALVDWDYIPDVESTIGSLSMVLPTNLKASVNSLLDAENKNKKDIEWNKLKLGLHIEDKDNPHNVTPDQIGAETPAGAQAKVDALAGEGNTKTVKQLDNELSVLAQQLSDLLSGGEEYTATLQNGWSGNLTYRKNLLGQVVLSGQLTAGDTAPSTQICVLPSGFRPKHMLAIPAYNGTQGVVGTAFQLSASGILYPRNGANINLNSGDSVYIHIIFSTI